MEEKAFTTEQIKELAAIFNEVRKNTPASTTLPAGGQLHGPLTDSSGNWSVLSGLGVRPEMWSAMTRPRSLVRALQAPMRSFNYNELLEIQTGVTPGSGTNATGFCADPPDVTGDMKVCRQNIIFGDYYGKTKLNAIPKVGQVRNYADVTRQIINAGPGENPLIPDFMYRLDDTQSVLQYNLWLFGQSVELTLERVLIQGNSTLTSVNTQLGFISEFDGLDRLIKTGYTDAVTSKECPAVDSYVLDFEAALGNTIPGDAESRYIQDALNDMIYALNTRAEDNTVNDFVLAVVMRKELFRRITDYIACNYASSRCSVNGTNTRLNIEGSDFIRLRDGMRTGKYILVDGVEYPVIFSTGIDLEGTAQDTFRTDIYFVPISGKGRPLTYLEYFPMDNPYATEASNFPVEGRRAAYNNGLWMAGVEETAMCNEYHFASRMRLILDTPFLAGKITDITFTYDTDMTRDPYSGESMYADGGVSYRTS
jgi:hypothetical protein